ncbi:MAG: ligand-binding protein SH3 [Thermoprotei archaeon]|nr:MAG: ligand-binding protein SH3 [Thermoprotei archaeon]
MLSEELKVFLLALIPVLETRASIPFGIVIANLPALEVLLISIIGNLIPAPFLLLGLSALEKWALSGDQGIRGFIAMIYRNLLFKIRRRGEKYIERYGLMGLAIFVAIPLPGSGVWTGSLLSHILGLKPQRSIIAIAVGSLIAACLILAGTLGIISLV